MAQEKKNHDKPKKKKMSDDDRDDDNLEVGRVDDDPDDLPLDAEDEDDLNGGENSNNANKNQIGHLQVRRKAGAGGAEGDAEDEDDDGGFDEEGEDDGEGNGAEDDDGDDDDELHKKPLDDPQSTGIGRLRERHERVTTNVLTKYERGRILGARATQIADNAPVLVPLEGDTDPYVLACRELQLRVLPFIIRRYLPDGTYEDWAINELEVELDRMHDDRYLSSNRIVAPSKDFANQNLHNATY